MAGWPLLLQPGKWVWAARSRPAACLPHRQCATFPFPPAALQAAAPGACLPTASRSCRKSQAGRLCVLHPPVPSPRFPLCPSRGSWRVGEAERARSPLPSSFVLVAAAGSLCCALTRTVIFIFAARFPRRSLERAEEPRPVPGAGYTLPLPGRRLCGCCEAARSAQQPAEPGGCPGARHPAALQPLLPSGASGSPVGGRERKEPGSPTGVITPE